MLQNLQVVGFGSLLVTGYEAAVLLVLRTLYRFKTACPPFDETTQISNKRVDTTVRHSSKAYHAR